MERQPFESIKTTSADVASKKSVDEDISKTRRKKASRRLVTSFNRLKLAIVQGKAKAIIALLLVICLILILILLLVAMISSGISPSGRTGSILTNSKQRSSTLRFSLRGQKFALHNVTGSIYVADEDLASPRLLNPSILTRIFRFLFQPQYQGNSDSAKKYSAFSRAYNARNARELSPLPGRVTLLPDFLDDLEISEFKKHIDRADHDGQRNSKDETVLSFGRLESDIVHRLKPFVGLDERNAMYIVARDDARPISLWKQMFALNNQNQDSDSKETARTKRKEKQFSIYNDVLPLLSSEAINLKYHGVSVAKTMLNNFRGAALSQAKHKYGSNHELLELKRCEENDPYLTDPVASVFIFLDDEPTLSKNDIGPGQESWRGRMNEISTGGEMILLQNGLRRQAYKNNEEVINDMDEGSPLARDANDLCKGKIQDVLRMNVVLKKVGDKKGVKTAGKKGTNDDKIDAFALSLRDGGPMKIRPKKGTAVVMRNIDFKQLKRPTDTSGNPNMAYSFCKLVSKDGSGKYKKARKQKHDEDEDEDEDEDFVDEYSTGKTPSRLTLSVDYHAFREVVPGARKVQMRFSDGVGELSDKEWDEVADEATLKAFGLPH